MLLLCLRDIWSSVSLTVFSLNLQLERIRALTIILVKILLCLRCFHWYGIYCETLRVRYVGQASYYNLLWFLSLLLELLPGGIIGISNFSLTRWPIKFRSIVFA
jgi:hypothetical protein